MSTTIAIIEQVRERLSAPTAEVVTDLDYKIEMLIPQSLYALALTISSSPSRALLEKQFTSGALVAGVAALSTSLSATEPILLPSRRQPFTEVTHASVSIPFVHIADRTLLSWESSLDFAYYTLDGTDIVIKPPTNVTLTGTLSVQASYVPLLSSIQDQLVPKLVDEIIRRIANEN